MEGLPIVRAEHLIPLKARAWLDLSARQQSGTTVDQRDIRKHHNDVVRLSAIIDPDYQIEIPGMVQVDMANFIAALRQVPPDLPALGLPHASMEDLLGMLM